MSFFRSVGNTCLGQKRLSILQRNDSAKPTNFETPHPETLQDERLALGCGDIARLVLSLVGFGTGYIIVQHVAVFILHNFRVLGFRV